MDGSSILNSEVSRLSNSRIHLRLATIKIIASTRRELMILIFLPDVTFSLLFPYFSYSRLSFRFRRVSGRHRSAQHQIRDRMEAAKAQQEFLGGAREISGRGAERGSPGRGGGSYR